MNLTKKGSCLLGTLSAAILLGGCAADNPWGAGNETKGKIHLSLQTDGDVKSAKPAFRSGENDFSVADYLTVPDAADFEVKLEKKDGSYSGYFHNLDELNNSEEKFTAGAYTLTAYSGKKGEQGFDCAYFEGTADFTVLSDQTTNIDVTAAMANSMIVLEYTQEFQDYMQAWDATIFTEGVTGGITYSRNETRAAFVEPNNVHIGLSFTTNEGKSTTVDVGGVFAPLAKTLYHITIDVKAKETGATALEITFDDSLEDVPVEIDLTDELFTTPAPSIQTVGFQSGETVDMLEGTASEATLKMNVTAKAGLAKAYLTINSDNYSAPWGDEIDLCHATEPQQTALTNAGISAIGFFRNPDKLAFLDLTDFGKSLPKGTHTIQLRVEDTFGALSEAATVTLDSQDITIECLNQYILFGSNEATMTLAYNGSEPEKNITFKAINEAGNMVATPVKKCELVTGTRAFETKTYVFTLGLRESTRASIKIEAYHKGTLIGTFDVPVTTPDYNIATDAYANSVDIRITSADATVEAAIVNNLKVRAQGTSALLETAARNTGTGVVSVKGLEPNKAYLIEVSLDGENWGKQTGFTTETELTIPNGDFSSVVEGGINSANAGKGNLQVGGAYNVWPVDYYVRSSYLLDSPSGWATKNDLTAFSGSSNWNTWFVVPSTYVKDGMAEIRSVGYNHSGTTPSTSGGAFNTTYYCTNAPAETQLNKTAGELFLGTYSYTGTESRSNGIPFSSRPSKISFDYTYSPVNSSDKGVADIYLYDSEGNIIVSKSAELSGSSTFTLDCKYAFGKKISKLYICFKSSNQATPTVNIPTGDALHESGANTRTIDANTYHALATGSVLKIDNVTAHYDRFPAASGAPKRKTTSKTRK